MVIHTYGDLVNLHPYLHALLTDGVFTATVWFVAFPKIDLYTLEHLFRHCVLRLLLRERRIDESVIRKLLGSKMHPVLKRNFEVFSAGDWLAALTAHIPNAGEHLVRYYGWYSNVNRGKRRKAQGGESTTIEDSTEVSGAAAKRAGARLIKQVYEVDPLVCPRCAGAMRIIAFLEQPEVIAKILTHVGLWPARE